jgi:hypothetical protein
MGVEHTEHLKACIEKHRKLYFDWTASAYCGLKLYWYYEKQIVDLSVPGYTRPENAPHTWNPPVYGAKTQFMEVQEEVPLLPPKDVTRIQQLAGTLL